MMIRRRRLYGKEVLEFNIFLNVDDPVMHGELFHPMVVRIDVEKVNALARKAQAKSKRARRGAVTVHLPRKERESNG